MAEWRTLSCHHPNELKSRRAHLTDPATLDRFAFQLRCDGLLGLGRWEDAASVIDRFTTKAAPREQGTHGGSDERERSLCATELAQLQTAVERVRFPPEVRDGIIRFIVQLIARHKLDASNSCISDRTFLVKAPKLLRACAVAAGRDECMPEDLRVLQHMMTFRLPEHVESEQVLALLEEVVEEARHAAARRAGTAKESVKGDHSGGTRGGDDGGEQSSGQSPPAEDGGAAVMPAQQQQQQQQEQQQEQQRQRQQQEQQSSTEERPGTGSSATLADATAAELATLATVSPSQRSAGAAGTPRPRPPPSADTINSNPETVQGLERLLEGLDGQFERSSAVSRASSQSDGAPRGWRRLRSFADFAADTDGVDAATWCSAPGAATEPRAIDRSKPRSNGALAILRDVSTSMHGLNAKWASSLTLRVVELARRRKMHVGLIEYSDTVTKLHPPAGFFSQDYGRLAAFARRLECQGLTDYEASISGALREFQGDRRLSAPNTPKHILFVTDGAPTKGDRRCRKAREMAGRAGVRIHTLFLQSGPYDRYPPVLNDLANDSGGLRMQARVLDHDRGHIDLRVLAEGENGTERPELFAVSARSGGMLRSSQRAQSEQSALPKRPAEPRRLIP